MTKIETNRAVVMAVSQHGCTVAVNGRSTQITWDALHEAASQDVYCGQTIDDTTRELARFYRQVQVQARLMVSRDKTLPISSEVHQDSTNVWWVATFLDVAGVGGWIPRCADEGGTHAHEWMAQQEADARSARLRKLGYTVIAA